MKFWSYGWFSVKQPKTNQTAVLFDWLKLGGRLSLLTLVLWEDAPLPDGVVGGEALLGDGGVGGDGHGQDAGVGDDSARGRVSAVPADVRTHWGRRQRRTSASHLIFLCFSWAFWESYYFWILFRNSYQNVQIIQTMCSIFFLFIKVLHFYKI